MSYAAGKTAFAAETLHGGGRRDELGRDQFQGDAPAAGDLLGLIHAAHASRAEQAQQSVAADFRWVRVLVGVGCGSFGGDGRFFGG